MAGYKPALRSQGYDQGHHWTSAVGDIPSKKTQNRFVDVKTRLVAILTIVFGSTPGMCAVTAWLSTPSVDGVLLAADRAQANPDTLATAPPDRSGPSVVVDREEHDFGKADVGVTGHHQFVFTNTGNEPLVLTRGKSTCGCCTCVCTVRLPENTIAPGESAKVTLEWKSKLYVGSFRQTATILTNDSNRRKVTLLVTGRFAGPVGIVPSQLSFNSVRLGQAAMGEVHLYTYLEEPLEIAGCQLSNPQTAKYFDVAWDRLTARQLREEGEARGGYSVRITVKRDLPVGAFQQRIVFKTNSKSVPTIEVPVQGSVVSDISIAGRGWNAQTGVLAMGTVRSARGAEWPLIIVARGPHAKDMRLTIDRIVPGLLQVELGPTRYIADKAICLTQLKIRIPPGSGRSMHLGSEQGRPGRITLQTTHPDVPELNVHVRFAVTE